jgi:lipopolysaccharide export system protein LptA
MISVFTKKLVRLLPMLVIGAALLIGILAYGQTQIKPGQSSVGYEIKAPWERYEAPNQSQIKTFVTLQEARPQGPLVVGKDLKIETFRTNGDTEIVITAPDCTVNSANHTAYSPGPIQIRSGDSKMRIDGVGFVWNTQTNAGAMMGLVISNKVHTILNKDLVKDTNAVYTVSRTNSPVSSNDVLHVYSDHLTFDRQINLITYTGHVRVEDVQLDLLCDVMTVQLKSSTNGGIDKIIADRNVVIIDKAHGGRTTGDQAVYSMRDGKQVVELTGNPHFQDGLREGTAKVFVFERLPDGKGSLLHAVGDAFLKIPPGSIGKEGVFLTQSTTTPTNAPVATNRFVELYADSMTFRLPPTNGPVQAITAEKNVLIVDRERKSQATGGHAFYDSNTGYLELTTNALWQADQRLAKGEILIFNQKEGSFEARTNAYLKLPASALGRSTPFQSSNSQVAATNQFIEILCKSYEAKNELLTFHDHVQAAFAQGDAILGTLECENLKVGYTTIQVKSATGNKTVYDLKSIVAEKHVYAHQLPFKSPRGRTIEKEMKCDLLTMLMRPGTNLVQRVVAYQNVLGIQTEIGTNGLPTRTTLASEIVTADFFPYTNQVETAVADRNVVITRDSKRSELHTESIVARGARGIYTGTNDMMALTGGHPSVTTTNGTLTGEPLLLDRRRNKVLVPNYNLRFTVKTNAASIKAASAAGAK